jgi:hypothetical protein
VQLLIGNGVSHYKILWCQEKFSDYGGELRYVHDKTGGVIAHWRLTEQERLGARIIRETDRHDCERCDTCFSEVHHWAPHALFKDEAWKWPTSYLCQACHRLWHCTINGRKVIARPQYELQAVEGCCEHCKRGSDEVDVFTHHWAPKQLFADWDKWPVAHLCFDCIVEWRSVMLNKQAVIDPRVVAIAKEQCGIEIEEPEDDYYPVWDKGLAAFLMAIEADLEEANNFRLQRSK